MLLALSLPFNMASGCNAKQTWKFELKTYIKKRRTTVRDVCDPAFLIGRFKRCNVRQILN